MKVFLKHVVKDSEWTIILVMPEDGKILYQYAVVKQHNTISVRLSVINPIHLNYEMHRRCNLGRVHVWKFVFSNVVYELIQDVCTHCLINNL